VHSPPKFFVRNFLTLIQYTEVNILVTAVNRLPVNRYSIVESIINYKIP